MLIIIEPEQLTHAKLYALLYSAKHKRTLVTKQFRFPLTFIVLFVQIMEVNVTRNCLDTNIQ